MLHGHQQTSQSRKTKAATINPHDTPHVLHLPPDATLGMHAAYSYQDCVNDLVCVSDKNVTHNKRGL
jgi:hypothetical protein